MTFSSDRTASVSCAAALLLACASPVCFAAAQEPASSSSGASRALIFLDPAHGGPDAGAHLPNGSVEKDVTLALAGKMRVALGAAGFAVITTRNADITATLPDDQRAELADRTRPFACVIVHATGTGFGAHLYVSQLEPAQRALSSSERQPFAPVAWDKAQAAFVDESTALRKEMAAALASSQVPVLTGGASVRPLDNLLCPAVAIEIAPLQNPNGDRTSVTDAEYQQRVAESVATALKAWRTESQPEDTSSRPGDMP